MMIELISTLMTFKDDHTYDKDTNQIVILTDCTQTISPVMSRQLIYN